MKTDNIYDQIVYLFYDSFINVDITKTYDIIKPFGTRVTFDTKQIHLIVFFVSNELAYKCIFKEYQKWKLTT